MMHQAKALEECGSLAILYARGRVICQRYLWFGDTSGQSISLRSLCHLTTQLEPYRTLIWNSPVASSSLRHSPKLLTSANVQLSAKATISTQPSGREKAVPPRTQFQPTCFVSLASTSGIIVMSRDLITSLAHPITLLTQPLVIFISHGPNSTHN